MTKTALVIGGLKKRKSKRV